jgi:hypothetical protein
MHLLPLLQVYVATGLGGDGDGTLPSHQLCTNAFSPLFGQH